MSAAVMGVIGLESGPRNRFRLALLPEVGAAMHSTTHQSAGGWTLGLGAGYTISSRTSRWSTLVIGVVPSYFSGTYSSEGVNRDARGIRVAAIIEWHRIIGVQATQQFLDVEGVGRSQSMLTGSLNVIPLLAMLSR
jgi:hypothetical protein